MKKLIRAKIEESIELKRAILDSEVELIERIAQALVGALKKKKKILIFGNGGSAADSQHMAAELLGRFQKDRQPFSAIALTTDTSILTAIGNDSGFDAVFARQIEALGARGDAAIAISTSGQSQNVIAAVRSARRKGMKVIGLTGARGGRLKRLCDICFVAPAVNTARIQEAHSCVLHIICEIIENSLT